MIDLSKIFKKKKKTEVKKKHISSGEMKNLPIKAETAKEIAFYNLKNDFWRNSNRKGISYLGFTESNIELVLYQEKLYWKVNILDGEVSQIICRRYGDEFLDGFFTKKELKTLCCLIDTETGEYIYFPE